MILGMLLGRQSICRVGNARARWILTGMTVRNKQNPSKTHRKPMNVKCNNTQEIVLQLNPVDADGNPVVLDDDAVTIERLLDEGEVAPTDTATATVGKTDDGKTQVILRSGSSPEVSRWTLKGDALPGEGVEIIEEIIEFTVVSASAVSLGIVTLEIRKKSSQP